MPEQKKGGWGGQHDDPSQHDRTSIDLADLEIIRKVSKDLKEIWRTYTNNRGLVGECVDRLDDILAKY